MFKKVVLSVAALSGASLLYIQGGRYWVKTMAQYMRETARTHEEENKATEYELKAMKSFYLNRTIPWKQRVTKETLKPGVYSDACIGYIGYHSSSEHPDFAPEPDILGVKQIVFVRDDGSIISRWPGKERKNNVMTRYRVVDDDDLDNHYYEKRRDLVFEHVDKHYDL